MRWDLVLVAVLVAVLVVVWLVGLWVVRRQVSAITYLEMAEELVIRKGRLARTLVSVPYGRLQFVDVQSGPLARRLGLAELELHTASPQTGGTIPGLPIEEAEALRQRLAALGESQRAGL
jgi:membrane protein YdbS with pleckstrin-like domain